MHPLVAAQVDALLRDRDARDERLLQRLLGADQREHGPVVVGIGMDVEERRVRREGVADRADHRCVPPLGDVRNGLEREHGAYPTTPS